MFRVSLEKAGSSGWEFSRLDLVLLRVFLVRGVKCRGARGAVECQRSPEDTQDRTTGSLQDLRPVSPSLVSLWVGSNNGMEPNKVLLMLLGHSRGWVIELLIQSGKFPLKSKVNLVFKEFDSNVKSNPYRCYNRYIDSYIDKYRYPVSIPIDIEVLPNRLDLNRPKP